MNRFRFARRSGRRDALPPIKVDSRLAIGLLIAALWPSVSLAQSAMPDLAPVTPTQCRPHFNDPHTGYCRTLAESEAWVEAKPETTAGFPWCPVYDIRLEYRPETSLVVKYGTNRGGVNGDCTGLGSASREDVIASAVYTVDADQNVEASCPTGNGSPPPPMGQGRNGTNPIQSAIGRKIQPEYDGTFDGIWPIERTYLSSGSRDDGMFGWGWQTSLYRNARLVLVGPDGSPIKLRLKLDDGRFATFSKQGSTWAGQTPHTENVSIVDAPGGGFILRDGASGEFHYGPTGQLNKRNLGGRELHFHYGANGRVIRLTSSGRELAFAYQVLPGSDSRPVVKSITWPDGGTTRFEYSRFVYPNSPFPASHAHGVTRLTRVIHPDGRIRQYHYEAAPISYPYGESTITLSRPWLLTGITDERDLRSVTWGYDDQHRAVLSVHGDAAAVADRVSLAYPEYLKRGLF